MDTILDFLSTYWFYIAPSIIILICLYINFKNQRKISFAFDHLNLFSSAMEYSLTGNSTSVLGETHCWTNNTPDNNAEVKYSEEATEILWGFVDFKNTPNEKTSVTFIGNQFFKKCIVTRSKTVSTSESIKSEKTFYFIGTPGGIKKLAKQAKQIIVSKAA